MQKNIHPQVKDAINVLGVTLKVSEPLTRGRCTCAFPVSFTRNYRCAFFFKMLASCAENTDKPAVLK